MNPIIIAAIVLLMVLGYIGYGVFKVLVVDKSNYATYWEERRREPIGDGDIRLVALGDSTVQALGASAPLNGTVGLVAALIERQTGRPVHIDNVSVSGAKTADVVKDQAGMVDVVSADIILVAVGANDANRETDVDQYLISVSRLVKILPPEKTIMADVAMIKNRERYQEILDGARTERGILRADIEKAFRDRPATKYMSARDFFHPNDYGYSYWFDAFEPAVRQLIKARGLGK